MSVIEAVCGQVPFVRLLFAHVLSFAYSTFLPQIDGLVSGTEE